MNRMVGTCTTRKENGTFTICPVINLLRAPLSSGWGTLAYDLSASASGRDGNRGVVEGGGVHVHRENVVPLLQPL